MIGLALRAAAAFVEDNASSAAWDPHQRLTDEKRFAKGEKIKGVARELRSLADAVETRTVRYAEYGVLKHRLYVFGFPLTPTLDQNVATAFREAEGPVQPLSPGWFKK